MNSSKFKPNLQTNLAKKTFEDADSQTRQVLKVCDCLKTPKSSTKELGEKNLTNTE